MIAWILLGGAIVATLIAISGSQRAQQKKIENMDSEVLQRLYPDDPRYKDLDVTANPFTNRVHWANAVSLYCAVAGLLSLIFFVFINFPSPKKHEQQEPTKPAATAAAGQHTEDKLLRADEKPSSPATAPVTPATTIQKREVTMPTQPNPPPANPPVPQPSKGTGPLTESYVPTKNPVAPPTPPQNPTAPVKDGK